MGTLYLGSPSPASALQGFCVYACVFAYVSVYPQSLKVSCLFSFPSAFRPLLYLALTATWPLLQGLRQVLWS